MLGSESGGSVSKHFPINPPKSTLLHTSLLINNVPLQILIDTGAFATCISDKALSRLAHVRFIDRTPRSFLLANGLVTLHVSGNVELSIQIENELIAFSALVTEKLCVDLILGIDFLSFFAATIDVERRQVSIKKNGRQLTLNIDRTLRPPFVPISSVSTVLLPPTSTMDILVSSPVSSLSSIFIPTSTFLEQPHLSIQQKHVIIGHHLSSLSITNHSSSTQTIPQHFCFGYLQVPSFSTTFFDQISELCKAQNEKRNKQSHPSALFTHHQLPQRIPHTRSSPNSTVLQPTQAAVVTLRLSLSIPLPPDLVKLVEKLDNEYQRTEVSSLLSRFSNLFDTSKHNISTIVIPHVFNTIPHSPPASRPHRNPHHKEETQKLIDEFLEAGIIHESHSLYAAPAFIVPRKDNRPDRLVVDYRALNKITIPDASPLPHIEDTLQELGRGFKYIPKLDLKSGYHQFQIPKADQQKTTFVVSSGHYEFSVLPMGPTNSPQCFQKTMSNLLNPCRDFVRVYLDDIIIYSKTFEQHLSHLTLVFEIFTTNKIVLSPSKCEIAVTKVKFLGHIVSENTLTPNNDAIQAIIDLREPRTLKEANKFLGGLAYYRKFVPQFAHIAAPIHKVTNLTKAKRHLFKWTEEQSKAFFALKRMLTTELYLRFPVDGYPIHLSTDASGIAIGGVLFQEIDGERRNILYHSKALSSVERTYSVPEKEALAIFQCLQRMRTYVLGRTVYIHTDHCPICGLLKKPIHNRRIERVANLIQEYNIAEMKHITGRSNCLPDFLSRPFDDPLSDIPYGVESKQSLIGTTSISSMSLPSTNYLLPMVLRPRHRVPPPSSSQDDEDTNNRVMPTDSNTDSFHMSDSPFPLEIITPPSPNAFNCADLKHAQDNDPDIQRIITQLNNSPTKSTLHTSFVIKDHLLHKLVTLSCKARLKTAVPYLPTSMIKSLLTAMHDDPYQGGHFSTDKMFSKLVSRYWWPKMRETIRGHVQACTLCQQYNYSRHKPAGHLHPIPPTDIPYSVIRLFFVVLSLSLHERINSFLSSLIYLHVTSLLSPHRTTQQKQQH